MPYAVWDSKAQLEAELLALHFLDGMRWRLMPYALCLMPYALCRMRQQSAA